MEWGVPGALRCVPRNAIPGTVRGAEKHFLENSRHPGTILPELPWKEDTGRRLDLNIIAGQSSGVIAGFEDWGDAYKNAGFKGCGGPSV